MSKLNYEEKKEARKERYENKAKQFKKEAEDIGNNVHSKLQMMVRRLKTRIEKEKAKLQCETKEYELKTVSLKVDVEDNRIKLYFPGKPEKEIRIQLKSNGLRWAHNAGCWQKNFDNCHLRTILELLVKLEELTEEQKTEIYNNNYIKLEPKKEKPVTVGIKFITSPYNQDYYKGEIRYKNAPYNYSVSLMNVLTEIYNYEKKSVKNSEKVQKAFNATGFQLYYGKHQVGGIGYEIYKKFKDSMTESVL